MPCRCCRAESGMRLGLAARTPLTGCNDVGHPLGLDIGYIRWRLRFRACPAGRLCRVAIGVAPPKWSVPDRLKHFHSPAGFAASPCCELNAGYQNVKELIRKDGTRRRPSRLATREGSVFLLRSLGVA